VRLTTPWRKAIRDLGQEGGRTLLVVLAIALGIAGFGSVLSTYAVLTRELNAGYLATNPASATLFTDRVDDELIGDLLAKGGVADAEARRVLSGRIKARPGDWKGLQLFVVKDYSKVRVSKLVPQEGAWPPAPGELLIERDAFQVIHAQLGGTVTVKTAKGQELTLRVSGSVHDVGQAQARMEQIVYGYIGVDTLSLLGEEPYLDQLKIVAAGNALDEPHVRAVAADVKQWLESRGHPVQRVDVPPPGKHPHADLTGLLLLAQSGFGLFALALSGILVVNLVTALMASELRQIGVMKAVGGTQAQIGRLYLSQALLLGGAAIVIAVPAGALGARAICRAMAVFLNFDITSFAVPAWVYALQALVGLGAPLLAAAYPVVRGTSISVREALAETGVGQHVFGTSGVDRALAGLGGLARPVLLALRNSFRRRVRMALTVVTLAAGGVFFMAALNVRGSMIHTLDRMFGAMRYDLIATFSPPVPSDRVETAVRSTRGITGSEGWITTEASIAGPGEIPEASTAAPAQTTPSGHPGGGTAAMADRFTVVALPPESALLDFQLSEGRGLRKDDANAIVINTRLAANEPSLAVGGEVSLRMGHRPISFRIVGKNFEPFAPPTAYVSRMYLDTLGGGMLAGQTNSVRLVIDPGRPDAEALVAVKAALEESLLRQGLRPLSIASKGERRVGFDEHMRMIYVFLVVVSCILGGVGGLGLMTTMGLNVLERRRELGVLRAIGASPRAVWSIILAEAGLVVVSSWVLAALAAWPISQGLGSLLVRALFRTGLDFAFEWRGPAVWLVVCLTLAAVASALPARRAGRLSVREALAHE
jgi:putative ABC transport system permease protein